MNDVNTNENESLKKLIGLMDKVDSIVEFTNAFDERIKKIEGLQDKLSSKVKSTDAFDERIKKLEGLQDKISSNEESIKELNNRIKNFNESKLTSLEQAIEYLKKEIENLKSIPRIAQESAEEAEINNIKLKCNQIRNLLDDIEILSDSKSVEQQKVLPKSNVKDYENVSTKEKK